MHKSKALSGLLVAASVTGLTLCSVQPAHSGVVDTRKIAPQTQSQNVSSVTEGREIFDAIFFGSGDKAAQIAAKINQPELDRLVAANAKVDRQSMQSALDKIHAAVGVNFGHFHAEMTSGDVFRVEAALGGAQSALVKLFNDNFEKHGRSAVTDEGDGTGLGVFQVAYVAVYAITAAVALEYGLGINIAVAINAAVAVNAAVTEVRGKNSVTTDSRQRQQIAALTKTLASA